jgi:hypothetical protein
MCYVVQIYLLSGGKSPFFAGKRENIKQLGLQGGEAQGPVLHTPVHNKTTHQIELLFLQSLQEND